MNYEIGSAIWSHLRGGTALTALLADGTASIFIDHASNDAELPYVLIAQQTGTWDYALGDLRTQSALWQVRAVSGSAFPKQAELIDTQIDARLHGGTPTITNYHLQRIVRESDLRFAEADGGQTIQNVGAIYRIDLQKT